MRKSIAQDMITSLFLKKHHILYKITRKNRMNLFKDLGLSEELFSIIEGLKFTKPTEIQEKSIPHIIKGKDVIGESATGSGKTLAFGCGIVENTKRGKVALSFPKTFYLPKLSPKGPVKT